jgi:ABC-type transport system involved in cytochrome bd biosynthesis fused ATPase/permease subunit
VNIVRGLLADVPAVVLDEPTDALDPDNKEFTLAKLAEHSLGRTVLIVSHERTGAAQAIRLHGGRLLPQ